MRLADKTEFEYDGVFTYVGRAISTATHTDELWSITRIEHDAVGKVIAVTHADGSIEPAYAWSDRKDLEYL